MPRTPLVLLGYQLTVPLLQKNLGETLKGKHTISILINLHSFNHRFLKKTLNSIYFIMKTKLIYKLH